MDGATYHREVDTCLARIAAVLENYEDLDFSTGDGLLTIEFEDGAKYVVNRQAAAHQMWFAAGARAWHYDWSVDASTWIDDRDGHHLYERIGEVVSAKLGMDVSFSDG